MILIEALFAPTVPSAPSPQNTACTARVGTVNERSTSSDRPVTSSRMPTVNVGRGVGVASSSSTALAIAGVNSLDDRPYRPPMTSGIAAVRPRRRSAAARQVVTSWHSGSAGAPGSLVRSRTAMRRAVSGRAARNASVGNGR